MKLIKTSLLSLLIFLPLNLLFAEKQVKDSVIKPYESLSSLVKSKDMTTLITKGYVVQLPEECGPCPEGYVCEACPPESILLSDNNLSDNYKFDIANNIRVHIGRFSFQGKNNKHEFKLGELCTLKLTDSYLETNGLYTASLKEVLSCEMK